MKKIAFAFLCFVNLAANAQTIFQAQEVDKAATPQGGIPLFQEYIKANLQVPFATRAAGIKGRVFLSGVIEPDGSVSELKVTRGLQPQADQEALRVVGLYRAWQPAVKDSKPVRQAFNYSVVFPDNPITNYDSTSHSLVDYFNDKFQYTQEPKEYHFRRLIPVDNNGVVAADVVFEEFKKKEWKPYMSATYSKKPMMYKVENGNKIDSLPAYRITARDQNWNSYVPEMIVQTNGQLLSTTEFQGGGFQEVSHVHYYPSGILKEQLMADGANQMLVLWYDNGQIAEVIQRERPQAMTQTEERIVGLWARTGQQHVKDGNGWAVKQENEATSQGQLVNGKKEGRWVSKLADSTLYIDEFYSAGVLTKGTIYDKGEVRTYTEARKNPQFKGGVPALGQFLSQNLRYPAEASRRNVSGKVYLTFVVCEDGSLCDYEILKGIGSGCDEEALRIVKEMSGKWEPGVYRGKKVRVQYNLPISFMLR
ncbi:TonB family protein [Runella defluvii]|uniref:TonB family protein n=1 Tax=Runella defluvii TaxID=370973 RepID=A0A7W6EQK9_9BACT|nr:energy transducer TonB [Runella defluvii]MBB3838618.1 TonB family protein [Runella defluvii]